MGGEEVGGGVAERQPHRGGGAQHAPGGDGVAGVEGGSADGRAVTGATPADGAGRPAV
ncbi:hypothetical protein V2I01_32685 [Micromonospora sp. BRA006-A]|nr:hypothetical protein [Micromonospora sp. BRA006-A]